MPCKHAELMMIYAKQAAEMDEPWKLWRFKHKDSEWIEPEMNIAFHDHFDYKQIPKTLSINGYEVPEPMRNKLRIGDEYWHIDPTKHKGVRRNTWMDSCEDTNALNAGTCHLTRDNCIAHAKALFSFTEVV